MTQLFEPSVTLNNGVKMPQLGLGTFAASGPDTRNAVQFALDAGYAHIDTAFIYGNEVDVGAAIKKSGVEREKLFITTKLWRDDQGYPSSIRACENSLKNLDMDYLDLYLIHWPVEEKLHDTWKALVETLRKGYVRAIGVSNFTIRLLKELEANFDVVPAVNQVEFSPFLFQKELLDYCEAKGIKITSYSPLTRGKRLSDPVLVEIALAHGKTAAQVILRWNIQHGIVTIPKSVHQNRIIENASIFDFVLSKEEMEKINRLDEGYRTIHPEFAPAEW